MHNIKKALKYAEKNNLVNRSKDWYIEANEFSSELSINYKTSLDKCAGVIAALSPGVSWEQNKKDADILVMLYDLNLHNEAFEHHKFSTYNRNVLKAIEILNSFKNPLDQFSNPNCGFKTRHFYLNIFNPYVNSGVTMDRHAVAIATGSNKSHKQGLTKKKYYDYAQEYIKIAKELELLPHELQAITWVAYKHAKDNKIEIY